MRSVELFTGAGGLAIGVSKAGFHHEAVIEWDRYACDTIRENQHRGIEPVKDWRLHQADVSSFDFGGISGPIDLLAGGPPCQPFSLGGKHRGHRDERNMFPAVVRAVRTLRPKAIIIENVKGLLRSSFAEYFEYITLQLSYPEITRGDEETWTEHLSRLECHHTYGHVDGLSYRVVFRLLNAANYGVPQRRERVFIVGFRNDVGAEWSFPDATHSLEALLWHQWVTGEYWDRHGIAQTDRPAVPQDLKSRVEKLEQLVYRVPMKPWRTVRDAITDLPDPADRVASKSVLNHRLNPGGRAYTGHTGSPLDEPSKTLKAGDHGVPGGENMLVYPDGRLRYFTVRESARLQTFADEYVFHGSWTEAMRQLGNAVPVTLAEAVASGVKAQLASASRGEKPS
jgi:DNA (cytosine-5)-methyltransferase 1